MKGNIADLRAMLEADPGAYDAAPRSTWQKQAENWDFYVTRPRILKELEARRTLVGNGQCAVLPQAMSGAPLTRFWRRGPRVKGNTKMVRGTVIAVFDPEGFYSDGSYHRHAAIYLGQNADGIQVLDQWHTRDVSSGFHRTLRYGCAPKSGPVNDGNYFHVVLTMTATAANDWNYAMGAVAATAAPM